MRLQDYWGIGPKTATQLEDELGTERTTRAIESIDIRAFVGAGLAHGEQGGGVFSRRQMLVPSTRTSSNVRKSYAD
jgi:hypothetical protein